MKNLTSKLITLILIISLFFSISYLFNKRFFINHEISAIKAYTYEIEKALENIK